jgi:ABC-2 type transport system permease protein
MSASTAFQPVTEHGWRTGFANLFRHELRQWLRVRRLLIHAAIWLTIMNGLVAAMLWAPVEAGTPTMQQGADTPIELLDPLIGGVLLFITIGGVATGVGVILVMQGVIIDEKKSGTAAWVLSKPVSRTAFILSRLIVNAGATLLLMVFLQSAVTYLLITARTGDAPALIPFIAGTGLLGLHLLFYLALTLMLGTLFRERGPVIAIPLAILFGAQLIQSFVPSITPLMPWELVMPQRNSMFSLAMEAMLGQPLSNLVPIIATAIWIVVFIGVAVWRFGREEL